MSRGVIALFALLMLVACGRTINSKKENKSSTTETKIIESNTVEVLYFHGKNRCVTCVAIGAEAQKVVEGLQNERVIMEVVDFSTAEGEKIADKYEIASSSIIVVRGDKVENLTKDGFRYAKSEPAKFALKLEETIHGML